MSKANRISKAVIPAAGSRLSLLCAFSVLFEHGTKSAWSAGELITKSS